MMWMSYTDTGNFEFHAFGDTEADARANLVKTFNQHLVDYAAASARTWPNGAAEQWTEARFDEWFGIRGFQVEIGVGFRDGSRILTDEDCPKCGWGPIGCANETTGCRS